MIGKNKFIKYQKKKLKIKKNLNVDNDPMIQWFEWYNDLNDSMIWMILKNELLKCLKYFKCSKCWKWYNDLNNRQKWICRVIKKFKVNTMIQWS